MDKLYRMRHEVDVHCWERDEDAERRAEIGGLLSGMPEGWNVLRWPDGDFLLMDEHGTWVEKGPDLLTVMLRLHDAPLEEES